MRWCVRSVSLDCDGGYVVSCEPLKDRLGTSMRVVTTRKIHGHVIKDDPEPLSCARVIRANVWCQGGTVLHLVDKILFPDELNMKI